MARIGSSGPARLAWLKAAARCELPLQEAGAYCGGLPHSLLPTSTDWLEATAMHSVCLSVRHLEQEAQLMLTNLRDG